MYIWGVYCQRIHRTLKYSCEYCYRDCDPDIVEPDCSDFYDYCYSQLDPLFSININYFQRVFFPVFLTSHILDYYFTTYFRTCNTPHGIYPLSSFHESLVDDILF